MDFIMLDGDKLVTDSRCVAKAFGKAHKNVLRGIDGMRDSKNPDIAEHCRLNFEPTSFEVAGPRGGVRKIPGYRMTKDGLAELAMSFTGEAARVIRIRFLAAFNAMANFIRRTQQSLWQQMLDWEQWAFFISTGGMTALGCRKPHNRP